MASLDVVVVSADWFSRVDLLPLFDKDMIISIMSPGDEHPRPMIGDLPRLNVQFHDVTEEIMDGFKLWRLIDDCHAEMIVDFAEEVSERCDRLIVHCHAGISRSPGVAIGLARYFPIGDENQLRNKFPYFNPVVAQKIWSACERRGKPPRIPERT